jgi:MFS family permease
MRSVLLSSWALFFGITFAILSTSLQGPLLAVRAFDEGFDTSNTGLIMAGNYVGFLVGALATPLLIRNVGHVKVFAASASIASGTALLYTSFVDPAVWFVLRFATGFCVAVIFIVSEAWLNQSCPNDVRGRIMSLYGVLSYFAAGAGALLLNLSDPQGYGLFILASVMISFGIVPLLLSAQPAPAFIAPRRLGVRALFHKAPLGVGAVFMIGLAEGALFGAGPIFADKAGLTTAEISIFMAVISLGGLILLWPIGILTDRYDRSKAMIAITVLAALVSFLLAVTPVGLGILIFLLTGLFSGLCLSIYGICSAITNDNLEPDEMVGCGATLFICFSVGMILGPVFSTEIIEAWQPSAYFLYLATVHVLIAVYAIALMVRRGPVPAPKRRPAASLVERRGQLVTPSTEEWSPKPKQAEQP